VVAVSSWWFPPIALGRIAALRVVAYAFVPLDVALMAGWVFQHQDLAVGLYRPLALARVLHLPAPTEALVGGLRAVLVVSALTSLAATLGQRHRLVRVAGGVTAITYLWWMLIAMGYGKVDHDRVAYLVLLFVLPTVGGARRRDATPSLAAGWAVRTTQVAVVATYFLAGWAKIRIGGWGWVNGGTLSWAVVRRGTPLSTWALDVPVVLRVGQWLLLAGELASPLLFAVRRERTRTYLVLALYAFHLVTFVSIGIVFLPHLVALAAFLPLEWCGRRREFAAVTKGYSSPRSRAG